MRKEVPKVALILAIVNPIFACLSWFAGFYILSHIDIREFNLFCLQYICIQSLVMVIPSLMTYCLITWKQNMEDYQLKILLVKSNVLFMVMMWIVANEYPKHLPEGPDYAAAFFALFALGTTGVFLAILLIIVTAEYIMRKNDAKSQILEQNKSGTDKIL